ncbi:caveolin-1-like [Liolophura sinensis]|uniref:caveolin-1-like n=1 Tax=Liolophura sinensis TaxID=3198878 RepID=UPI0031583B8F
MPEIDLISRDPNAINSHIQVAFEDVLAEPEGIHSFDCVWRFSYLCFEFWKNFCYKLATLCCGLCIAMNWGCVFAETAFYHVWYITPALKIMEINCGPWKKCCRICLSCLMDPCCESMGLLFHKFERHM